MRWLIITRRMGRRPQGGPNIELPGELDGTVHAATRMNAQKRAERSRPGVRVEVIAECSWRLMSSVERDRMLGIGLPSVPALNGRAGGRGATAHVSKLHCARKSPRISSPRRGSRGPARPPQRPDRGSGELS
jgi:hypothetical protein